MLLLKHYALLNFVENSLDVFETNADLCVCDRCSQSDRHFGIFAVDVRKVIDLLGHLRSVFAKWSIFWDICGCCDIYELIMRTSIFYFGILNWSKDMNNVSSLYDISRIYHNFNEVRPPYVWISDTLISLLSLTIVP